MASSHQISIQKRYLCDVVERESPIMDVQPTSLQQLCDTVTFGFGSNLDQNECLQ